VSRKEVVVGPILIVIVVLASVLLVVTAYMEWIGVMSLITPRSAARYAACRHLRAWPTTSTHMSCWTCRHGSLRHPLHGPRLHHR
jgi:hypothetical protein